MVREFSEEKRQEIFRLLDEIDMKEWKPFMEWCGSSVEEFGDWPDKLAVSAYTRYVDKYHERVLEINEMTRSRVNTVFENVAEIDARYAGRMKECQEKIKEQIAMVNTMTEFMQSMTDGNPNMALLCGGNVSKAVDRTESTQNGKEEQQPEVIVLDSGGGEDQTTSIINEAEAQGIIGKPEIDFMNQLKYYISYSNTISFGCLDGLVALYNNGLISEENYNCLLGIKVQTNGPGNYNIFDLKEQARNVYTEIEKVIAERTTIIVEAEAQGIIGEPEIAFMNQLKCYISYSDTISFGRIDGLEALYNNGLISEENYHCLLEIKSLVNGPGNYDIIDLKEQARNVYTEIVKVIAERTTIEKYIDENVFRDGLGWDIDIAKANLGDNFIEDMRVLMMEYGLTDEESITFFLFTISIECENGRYMLEQRSIDQFDGLKYTPNTCGAGLIQLTGPDQKAFLEYLISNTEDEEEKEILKSYIEGFKNYNKPDSKNPCDCIFKNPDLLSVAEYISVNYPIESALWYWCVYEKAEIGGKSLSLNECIKTDWNEIYKDDTYARSYEDYKLMMFTGTQCAVNGSEFWPIGIGRFFMSWNYVEFSKETYYDPDGGKHEDGSITLHYREDNTDPDDCRTAISYKPTGWDDVRYATKRWEFYNEHIDYFENL